MRLALGLAALVLITAMTMAFGPGGFLFTCGLFGVIWWARAG